MDRRKFITGIGGIGIVTGLSGCVEESREYYESQDDENEEPKEEVPKDEGSNMYADGLQISEKDLDGLEFLDYNIEIIDRDSYPDQPALLEITLRNISDETVRYGDVRNAKFWFSASEDYILVPEEAARGESYEYNSEFDVWESTAQFAQTLEYRIGELQPGREVQSRMLVLHQPITNRTESVVGLTEEQTFETGFQIRAPETRDGSYSFTLHAVHYEE